MRRFCAAALCLLVTGCTDSADPDPVGDPPGGDELLAPPAPGEGVQLKMVAPLESGRETEMCQMFTVDEEIVFNRSEVAFSTGSHHVLLFETEYTEIPSVDDDGNPVDAAAVHECPEGAADIWDVVRVVGGSQNPNGDNLLNGLPDGVAMKVKPGTVLLMNTHYINATPDDLMTEAAINLYTVDPAEVETEAGVLFYYNPFIHVGAQSQGRARMRCQINQDIKLLNVQSHMHKLGVGFSANLVNDQGQMMDEFYTNTHWEDVPIERFDPTLDIKAGESLDYWCDYDNYTSDDVIQGLTTKDEMCMLIGPYWPRDDSLEVCENQAGDYVATWIGNGTADCGESYGCMLDAINGPDDELEERFFGCVTNSCEAVADPMSGVVNCFLNGAGGDCDEACNDDGDCSGCLIDACAPQIELCGAAACSN